MADENKPEELKLREDTDGSVVIGDEPAPEEQDEHDEPQAAAEHDDHDDPEVEGETDAEAEARREKNRERRRQKKEYHRQKEETFRRELAARDRIINELTQRVSTVERKSTGSEMAQLEQAEREAVQAYNQFKDIHAKAVEQAQGAMASDAAEKMMLARQRVEQLQGIKRAVTQRQAAPQPLDPRLLNHAEQWMTQNKWYDPQGKDQDSAVALTIDQRMAQEGWDPTTPEYWDELSARIKRYLPHRANQSYNKPTGKRSAPPVAGSGRESSATGTSYRLSPERVQAIKQAGKWDDPAERAKMIKAFQQYDKERAA